jgi:hypothetical protein
VTSMSHTGFFLSDARFGSRQWRLHRDFCKRTYWLIKGVWGIWHFYHFQWWKFLTSVLISIPRSVIVSAIGMLVEVSA